VLKKVGRLEDLFDVAGMMGGVGERVGACSGKGVVGFRAEEYLHQATPLGVGQRSEDGVVKEGCTRPFQVVGSRGVFDGVFD
jgi:hypothetical protein